MTRSTYFVQVHAQTCAFAFFGLSTEEESLFQLSCRDQVTKSSHQGGYVQRDINPPVTSEKLLLAVQEAITSGSNLKLDTRA